jgi:hypothetical protein
MTTELPKIFKQTSDEPYIRHHYKLVYSNNQEVLFDNYMDVQAAWFRSPSNFVSHIEVIDIPQKKSKGFK